MTPAEVVNDFRRRYESTYVFVEFPDDMKMPESLFFISRVSDHEASNGTIELKSDKYGTIQLNMATDHTIKFKYPPVGVFQHGKVAYYLRRMPHRQWRQGLCNENAKAYDVAVKCTGGGGNGGLTFELVQNAYKGQTYSFREALAMLNGGKFRGIAIHDNFALILSVSQGEASHILLAWSTPIARIDPAGKLVMVMEEAFRPQIYKLISEVA